MPITSVQEQEKYLDVLGDYFRLLGFTESMVLFMVSTAYYFDVPYYEGWKASIPDTVSFDNVVMSLCFALGWGDTERTENTRSARWLVPSYGTVKLEETITREKSSTVIWVYNTR